MRMSKAGSPLTHMKIKEEGEKVHSDLQNYVTIIMLIKVFLRLQVVCFSIWSTSRHQTSKRFRLKSAINVTINQDRAP